MRALGFVLVALCACNIPDVTFIKGDAGGDGGGGMAQHCSTGIGFPSAPWPLIGPGLSAFAFGDLDGDGVTDLVAAAGTSPATYALHVLLGQGGGGFVEAQVVQVSDPLSSLVLAKLPGEGNGLGVVAASHDASMVTVVPPASAPLQLGPPQRYPTGPNPIAVAVGHFQDPETLDIVTANAGASSYSVLLGADGGLFGTHRDGTLSAAATALAVHDFDASGLDDVAVAAADGKLTIEYNAGAAVFAPTPVDLVDSPTGLAVADFDNDTHVDLAVISGSGTGTIKLFYGSAPGKFDLPTTLQPTVPNALAIAAGDLNADGFLDLAVTSAEGLHVLLGGSRATAFPSSKLAFTGTTPGGAAIATTPAMIATANRGDGTVALWRTGADGSPILPTTYAAPATPSDAIVADLGAGPTIIVTNSSDGTLTLAKYGSGASDPIEVNELPTHPEVVQAIDLDADGKLDLVVTDPGASMLYVLHGDGTGAIRDRVSIPITSPARAIAIGAFRDANGADLVVAEPASHKLALMRGAAGGPDSQDIPLEPDAEPVALAVGQLAGKPTIAEADATRREVALITQDTPGVFKASLTLDVSPGTPTGVAIGPLAQGEPNSLIVTVDDGAASMLYVLRSPTGQSMAAEKYPIAAMSQSPTIADVTGDAIPDVLYTGRNGSSISVLAGVLDKSSNTLTLAREVDYGTGAGPRSFAVADVTGDGVPDLIVPHGAGSLTVLPATCLP